MVNKAKNLILDLIYPPCCPFCADITKNFAPICEKCLDKLERIVGDVCNCCGSCTSHCICNEVPRVYDAVCAPLYYSDMVANAIHRYKTEGEREHYKFFAGLIAGCVATRFSTEFDIVTAVPMTNRKLKKRGFDHTKLLAYEVSTILNLEYRDTLQKISETREQKELGYKERMENVKGSFSFLGKSVHNMRILLIDDTKTTGATIEECAKILKENGAKQVFCATLALTREKEDEKS